MWNASSFAASAPASFPPWSCPISEKGNAYPTTDCPGQVVDQPPPALRVVAVHAGDVLVARLLTPLISQPFAVDEELRHPAVRVHRNRVVGEVAVGLEIPAAGRSELAEPRPVGAERASSAILTLGTNIVAFIPKRASTGSASWNESARASSNVSRIGLSGNGVFPERMASSSVTVIVVKPLEANAASCETKLSSGMLMLRGCSASPW